MNRERWADLRLIVELVRGDEIRERQVSDIITVN